MRALLVALAACASLPHVEPQPRTSSQQESTVVDVLVVCGSTRHRGTGVIISERHVLTAQHVTACPYIPKVQVTLRNGDMQMMVVTRENEKQDIAKMELAHAGRFGLHVPPPPIVPYYPREDDWVCAQTKRGSHCSPRLGPNAMAGQSMPGDSGSPVYDGGYLAGLVTRNYKEKNATIMTIVTTDWMEGT